MTGQERLSDRERYAPRDGVLLRAAIRSALKAVVIARVRALQSEQHAAYSELENAESDLRSALARVLP